MWHLTWRKQMNKPKYKHIGATGYLGSVILGDDYRSDLYYYHHTRSPIVFEDVLIIDRFGIDSLYRCTDVKTILTRKNEFTYDYINALAVNMLKVHLEKERYHATIDEYGVE
jgi:hypothetical protein